MDESAAEHALTVVEHHGLTRRDGAEGGVKRELDLVLINADDVGGHGRGAMPVLHLHTRPDADGINLQLVREDAQAQLASAQVTGDVFNVLDGPAETPTQAAERKEREIKAEVNRPAVPEAVEKK